MSDASSRYLAQPRRSLEWRARKNECGAESRYESRSRPADEVSSRGAIAAGIAELRYRSTPGLLKYDLVGRAIITTAIASPANNDKTSIVLTHLRVAGP